MIEDMKRQIRQPYRGRFIIVMANRMDVIPIGTTTPFETIIAILGTTTGSETREFTAFTMSTGHVTTDLKR